MGEALDTGRVVKVLLPKQGDCRRHGPLRRHERCFRLERII